MTMFKTVRAMALIGFSMMALAPRTEASIIYQTGFEAPDFSPGQLQGQGGWFNSTVPQVQNAFANGGTQAVEVDATGQSGQFGAAHSIPYDIAANGNASVRAGHDIMIDHLAGAVNWYAGAVYGDNGFINQAFVIGGTGELRLAGSSSGVFLTPGTWYRVEFLVDFDNAETLLFLNGNQISSQAFVNTPTTSLTNFVGPGISNTNGTDASIYYDNLLVDFVPVPEPASAALLGLGALVLVRRKRGSRIATNG